MRELAVTHHISDARHSASFYDVLQVSPSASLEVIHAAYRALAREYHPDVNPTPLAAQRMLELNAAHDVLGDTERRARYDLRLVRSHRNVSAFLAPAPVAGMRGRPRPHSPRRIEEERTAATPTRVGGAQVRIRIIVLALIIAAVVALTTLLWWTSQMLEDTPYALGSISLEAHAPGAEAAQPFLNRAETVAEGRGPTIWAQW
jgi:DnaJ domain